MMVNLLWLALLLSSIGLLHAFRLTLPLSSSQFLARKTYSSLFAEIRLLIQGTKNAYTTARTHDVLSYELARPVGEKNKRLAVLSEDGKLLPLSNVVEGGSEFVVDPKESPLSPEKLKSEGRLLRIFSSDRRGQEYVIEEYIDDDVYIPVIQPAASPTSSGDLFGGDDGIEYSDTMSLIVAAEAQLEAAKNILTALRSHQKSTEKVVISSPNAPRAVGPYSQAVRAQGLLFVSGCLGMDPTTSKMVEGGIEAQIKRALANLKEILSAGGSGVEDLTKVTILLADMKDYPVVNRVYAEMFEEAAVQSLPARTTYQVAALPLNALVELDAIAVAH